MRADLLSVEEVRYGYPESDWELRGVSFALAGGELLAIVGPNGSGKSTLLKIAAGVLAPAGGRVRLGERELLDMRRGEIARSLGYLPQRLAYGFDYVVEEVVAMGRFPHLSGFGLLGAEDLRVMERCMEQTDTLALRGRSLSRLSGGERQRVLLASVLAQEPRVLLLDEPTTSLDIHHQAAFFRLLRRFARAEGAGVAVVMHDLNVASFCCDRFLLLCDGAPAREGEADDVLRADVLSPVYGEEVRVDRDARSGRPIVLPGSNDIPGNPTGGAL